jgi:hypothetical protein
MKSTAGILAATILFGIGAAAVAAEPILGTWKLNKAKSMAGARPLPQSYVCTYSDAGDGKLKFAASVVTSEGEKRETSWVSKRDGTAVPFTGSPSYDSIVNYPSKQGMSGSWVSKKAGKEVINGKWSLSPDKKTLTWEMRGTDADGKPTQTKYVLDRQ